jgi:hypothetical protein
MQSLSICLILIMICQFSGCAQTSSTVSVIPITEIGDLPAHNTESELAVGADAYYSERQKSMFGEDLSRRGLLPIMVSLRNNGVQPLKVVPNSISLKFQDGKEVKAASRDTVFPYNPSAGYKIALGAAWLLGLGSPVLLLPFLIADEINPNDGKPLMRKECREKEIGEVTLAKGESAQGFVFFHIPQGVQQSIGAHLIVPYLPAQGRSGQVRVPLGGM